MGPPFLRRVIQCVFQHQELLPSGIAYVVSLPELAGRVPGGSSAPPRGAMAVAVLYTANLSAGRGL